MVGYGPLLWVKVNLSPVTSSRFGAFIFSFEVKAFEFACCRQRIDLPLLGEIIVVQLDQIKYDRSLFAINRTVAD